jgi:hypothetical protein
MKRGKSKFKWILGGLLLSVILAVVLVYVFREPILDRAGEFMAPRGDYSADIAILEGASFLDRSVANAGFELLKAGKVKRLVVVLHNINTLHRPYGYNDNYPETVRRDIRKGGLKENDFEIVVTPIRHPVTLTEAQGAMKAISQMNVRSAVLLAPGFHTRRSYLVYQHAANPYQIKIRPQACFNGYRAGKWWITNDGMRDFAAEFAKLVYYIAGGYIPFRFSY